MKFIAAAALALVAGVSASYNYPTNDTAVYTTEDTVVYTTEVVTAITTYCSEATTLTHGEYVYTVTEPGTITITDCPCTIKKPVYTTSMVYCHTCNVTEPTTPCSTTPYATGAAAPTYPPAPVVTAGAGKLAALSGAGLGLVLGAAALL